MKVSLVIPAEYNFLSAKLMHPNVFIIRAIRFGVVEFNPNLVIYILYFGLKFVMSFLSLVEVLQTFTLNKYLKWVFRQVMLEGVSNAPLWCCFWRWWYPTAGGTENSV
jgi:hypothetical protein